MSRKRSYSDSERGEALAALDANEGNVYRTARQVGVPRVTLIEWQKGRVSNDVSDIRQDKKKDLADKFEAIANQIVDAMPDKIEKAGLKDAAVAAGTAVDKMRLLRGEATEIKESRSTDRDWAEAQLVQLMSDFKLSREQAVELAKAHAPTVAKWIM